MSGLGRLVAPLLATACGVFTAYTAFQPELAQQKEEREGNPASKHENEDVQEKAISKAIMSDLREAREEVMQRSNGGFAWGIRKALFGYDPHHQSIISRPPGSADGNTKQGEESTGRE